MNTSTYLHPLLGSFTVHTLHVHCNATVPFLSGHHDWFSTTEVYFKTKSVLLFGFLCGTLPSCLKVGGG